MAGFEKVIKVRGQEILFDIWDIGGQRDFSTVPLVCVDADAVLIAFDLSRLSSLFSLKEWLRFLVPLVNQAGKKCHLVLVGTKFELFKDLPPQEQEEIVKMVGRFIDGLVREGKAEEAKKYRDSFRLIDDILHRGVENPPDKDDYGGLEFKETTKSDGSVDFIGVSFDCLADGCLSLSVINKAASYPYPIIKFPSARSNAPARQMSSVFQ
eukprot:Cvel_34878.t1-p1 / transcript=Cvel_34878.t1 / gene=Cvel_34878 / organism=Chromera_velia_CCMP2878 / gene_product=Septum-promoting GTP-binding protein 1, putative / transcript_product=Septum-promoting GTP-binding protein 1, putative / location=Cvel_scaffold6146:1-2444(-) / protein_length=209 / sequence_SO=supercontig / SO=protein_coding / is_pseudo=false